MNRRTDPAGLPPFTAQTLPPRPFFRLGQDNPKRPPPPQSRCECCGYKHRMLVFVAGKWSCADCRRPHEEAAYAARLKHEPVMDLVAIDRFRSSLPEHRLGWFDSLQPADQARLAEGADNSHDANQHEWSDWRLGS